MLLALLTTGGRSVAPNDNRGKVNIQSAGLQGDTSRMWTKRLQ